MRRLISELGLDGVAEAVERALDSDRVGAEDERQHNRRAETGDLGREFEGGDLQQIARRALHGGGVRAADSRRRLVERQH